MASPRRVLSVQSHVVHGYVGNKSAVFPLQLLGFEVDAVNSVQFCCHTGYPKFGGQVLDGDALWSLVAGLEENGLVAGGYSHLLTGYIGSATFLRTVLRTHALLRARCPDLTYVCDPVLGDHGELYVPEALVEIYKEEVVPLATLLTPNAFECELLTGVAVVDEAAAVAAVDALHARGVKLVALTSLDYGRDDEIAMLLSERIPTDGDEAWRSEQHILVLPRLRGRYTGTGDLTAALLLAWLTAHPLEPALALEKVGATLNAILRKTLRERAPRVIAGKEVPPEIALITSKAAIEVPPLRAPYGGARPVATCRALRGAIRAVAAVAAPPAFFGGRGLSYYVAIEKVRLTDHLAPDADIHAACAFPPIPPDAVLVVTGDETVARRATAAGYRCCAILPVDDAPAADDADDDLATRARGLSWFADGGGDGGDPPPPPPPPHWASDRSIAPYATSSPAGLTRLVYC